MTGCGYHQAGAAAHVPANVRTLAVPIFVSKVQAFNTETVFTQCCGAGVEYADQLQGDDRL